MTVDPSSPVGAAGEADSTLKSEPNPGPSIFHAFDCTHNPCRCKPWPDLNEPSPDPVQVAREHQKLAVVTDSKPRWIGEDATQRRLIAALPELVANEQALVRLLEATSDEVVRLRGELARTEQERCDAAGDWSHAASEAGRVQAERDALSRLLEATSADKAVLVQLIERAVPFARSFDETSPDWLEPGAWLADVLAALQPVEEGTATNG